MVTKVGMSKSLYNMQTVTNEYGIREHSEATSELVDKEIKEITLEAYQIAKKIVKEKRDQIEK